MTPLRTILPFLLLLGAAASIHAQVPATTWTLLPESPGRSLGGRFEDASFIDPNTGWVVNITGEIYHTADGGATWIQQLDTERELGERIAFRSVGFANQDVGWAGSLTAGRVLFETRDGGTTWTDITDRLGSFLPLGLCGLWVVDENLVFGVGMFSGPPRFIRSTDGGQTWTVRDLSAQVGTLVDVFFFDAQEGFAVGGSEADLRDAQAVVLRTTDGGDTWQTVHTSRGTGGEWGWKISFPTPTTGFISVERIEPGAKVLKSTDGGLTWGARTVRGSPPLQGLGFVTDQLGWISGRGATWMTTDGAETWTAYDLDGFVNRFRLMGDTLGYAVGRRVYKLSRSTATATEDVPEVPQARHLASNYPNPFADATTIHYVLPTEAVVTLTVHDVLGRRVRTLVARRQPPDVYRIRWDGTDDGGRPVAPGVYLYRLRTPTRAETGTMLRLRS